MKLALAVGLAAALIAGTAFAEPRVLKVSMDSPANSTFVVTWLKPWAEKVSKESNGTLKLEVYTDGALSKVGETYDRVLSGVVDIGWDLPLVYGQRFNSITVTPLGGLYDDAGKAAAAYWHLKEKGLVDKEFADFKVIAHVISPNVYLFNRDLPKDLTNLAGIKYALGSKARGQMVEGMGGVAVALKTSEFYQAMSKGVVDGVMTSIAAMQAWRLNEITKTYIEGPFGGGVATIVMNKQVYESLPPDAKKAIDANSGEQASREAAALAQQKEQEFLAEILAKDPSAKKVVLSGPALAKWNAMFDKLNADWAKTVPNGDAILAGFKAELAATK